MFWYPETYELFLVLVESAYLRATRLPSETVNNDEFPLLLIDTGETILLDFDGFPFEMLFVMPECLQKIPGVAIRCQLGECHVDHKSENEFDLVFYIVENLGDTLIVDIHPTKKEDDEYMESDDLFYASTDTESEYELDSGIDGPEDDDNLAQALNSDFITTDDPVEAVQGFAGESEDICRYYNAATGGCFKGANCKQQHVDKIDDATVPIEKVQVYTFDKCPAIVDSKKISRGTYNVHITEFITVNQFICFMQHADVEQSMQKVADLVNSPGFAFVKMPTLPTPRELVVVKTADGKFMRARVEEAANKHGKVKVLLLDTGKFTNVNISQLHLWAESLQDIPIRLVEMEIANIKPHRDESNTKEALELLHMFHSEVAGKFTVSIVDFSYGIKCILYDGEEGADIGLELANNGLAVERPFVPSESRPFILG